MNNLLKGLEIGRKEKIQITVSERMFAAFEGEVVHPVYSTVAMTYHMEWVSRKIILPYLNANEEGMGAAVKIKHTSAAPFGSTIIITATVTELRDNKVITNVVAENEQGTVGLGEVIQVILLKDTIKTKWKEAST